VVNQDKLAELTESTIEALQTVYDPEIPVNVYDLGLIYDIRISQDETNVWLAEIDMTLTTVNCPLADMIPGMIEQAVRQIPDFKEVVVTLVWDPPWDISKMSEEARLAMDMY
jgi:FeS assembly SUF system protein